MMSVCHEDVTSGTQHNIRQNLMMEHLLLGLSSKLLLIERKEKATEWSE